MRALVAVFLSLGLVGCATPRARHRVFVGSAIAAVLGVGLVATGVAIESSDSCHGSCRGNMEIMWSGGATMTFLAGSIAFIQYMTRPPKPEKTSVWNYVPVPQPKPQWPPSRTPDPTAPPPAL